MPKWPKVPLINGSLVLTIAWQRNKKLMNQMFGPFDLSNKLWQFSNSLSRRMAPGKTFLLFHSQFSFSIYLQIHSRWNSLERIPLYAKFIPDCRSLHLSLEEILFKDSSGIQSICIQVSCCTNLVVPTLQLDSQFFTPKLLALSM